MQFHDKSCDCGRCRRERRNRATQGLAAKIALAGGQVTRSTFVAKWQPYCDQPVDLKRMITSREAVDELSAMEVSALVPCRKCPKCLLFRQMKWRERALFEIAKANRTWWMTLTFSPTHLAAILLEAKGSEIKQIEAAAFKHVQKFLKRLRKGRKRSFIRKKKFPRRAFAPAVFRYLAVYERGEKYGRSHYHLFLHETGDKPIPKLVLEREWRSNVHARLVRRNEDAVHASYLTKYATKHFDIRPRASVSYGKHIVP